MRRMMLIAAVCCVGITASTGALMARPLEAEIPLKTPVCYERIYDAAHLAAHPRQEVTRIRLVHAEHSAASEPPFLNLELTVRREPGVFKLFASCLAHGRGLKCTPQWDAGSFRVDAAKDGSLLVTNRNMRLNPWGHDAEDAALDAIRLKGSDKAWRLHRVGEKCVEWWNMGVQ